MGLTQKSPEVFIADGPIATIGVDDIEMLRRAVGKTAKKRVRINAHSDGGDQLHEMIIAIDHTSYIRPHKHPGKSEAFHIVEGAVDIVIFDEAGEITRIVPLAAKAAGTNGGAAFYYRMSGPFFHTLIIRSDLLVVHEITNGPFRPEATVFAEFAPPDCDTQAAARYRSELEQRALAFAGSVR
jgi:cupin fold WbuC family metalloprotein